MSITDKVQAFALERGKKSLFYRVKTGGFLPHARTTFFQRCRHANNRSDILRAGAQAALLPAVEKVMTDSGLPADAIIVNPTDYVKVVSAALSTAHSLFSDNYDRFLGLPIVKSDLITAGTALVGAFKQAATIIAKGGRRVEIANQNEDDFTKNLVAIRAEERLALAVRIPAAFVKITEAVS